MKCFDQNCKLDYTSLFPYRGGKLRSVVANVFDCSLVINKFELPSCNYVHIWTNNLGQNYDTLILKLCINSTITVHLPGWLWH